MGRTNIRQTITIRLIEKQPFCLAFIPIQVYCKPVSASCMLGT